MIERTQRSCFTGDEHEDPALQDEHEEDPMSTKIKEEQEQEKELDDSEKREIGKERNRTAFASSRAILRFRRWHSVFRASAT